jgi:hypothetical protein
MGNLGTVYAHFDRRNCPPGVNFFHTGGGSINSVKRIVISVVKFASFDRVYPSSSSPQCERNSPQGGNSYNQLCPMGEKSAAGSTSRDGCTDIVVSSSQTSSREAFTEAVQDNNFRIAMAAAAKAGCKCEVTKSEVISTNIQACMLQALVRHLFGDHNPSSIFLCCLTYCDDLDGSIDANLQDANLLVKYNFPDNIFSDLCCLV